MWYGKNIHAQYICIFQCLLWTRSFFVALFSLIPPRTHVRVSMYPCIRTGLLILWRQMYKFPIFTNHPMPVMIYTRVLGLVSRVLRKYGFCSLQKCEINEHFILPFGAYLIGLFETCKMLLDEESICYDSSI